MREGRGRARRVLRRTGKDWRVVRMGRRRTRRTRRTRRWRIREGDSSLLYGVGYWVGLGV